MSAAKPAALMTAPAQMVAPKDAAAAPPATMEPKTAVTSAAEQTARVVGEELKQKDAAPAPAVAAVVTAVPVAKPLPPSRGPPKQQQQQQRPREPRVQSREPRVPPGPPPPAPAQNRAERKSRQAMEKLGLRTVKGVFRMTMRMSNGVVFVVKRPDVFKHPQQV